MQMVNAEVRTYLRINRERLEKAKQRKLKKNDTLDNTRIMTI